MNIEVKEIDEHEVEMYVCAQWEDVREDYAGLLKRYGRGSIKGFRQGSAPAAVIEKTYRKSIETDMGLMCSQRICRKALNTKGLRLGSPISISEVELEPHEKFSFKANFLRMPDFELPDYAHLDLQSESRQDKLTEISEKLLALVKFDIHNDFIDNELRFSESQESLNDTSLRKEAENRVRLMLILKNIADADSIETDEVDLNVRIEEMAHQNEVTAEELRSYLTETGGLLRLQDLMLAEQVLNYIMEINS